GGRGRARGEARRRAARPAVSSGRRGRPDSGRGGRADRVALLSRERAETPDRRAASDHRPRHRRRCDGTRGTRGTLRPDPPGVEVTSRRGRSRALNGKAVAGIALGLALLGLSLRGVDLRGVLREIRSADPLLFLAAIAAATAPMVVRAWRWRVLLEPSRPGTAFRSRFEATMIGFMANNVLPARVGEL